MKKLTSLIVKFRYIFLVIFTVFAGVSLYLQTKVNINDDIMKYLPKNSETKIGNDIMNVEFSKLSTSNLNVMFKDLSEKEKLKIYDKLSNVNGVSSVKYDSSSNYNKGKYTLYQVTVDDYSDSNLATNVYKRINRNFDVEGMSGTIFDENKPLLKNWIVIFAIACALLILIALNDYWFEPFLYLISIGIAVFINKGTNIIFPSVSSITNAIVAVLQLALSMDYSIMLSNRYRQEKARNKDKITAMKDALYQSFGAISSSSLTTIVGLLALVFMSFTIGRDLGFILAKGVLLSLISIFFCLPALLLLFDGFIQKTKKKALNFKLNKIANYSYKTRHFQTILIVLLFVVAFLLKGNVQILYTDIQQDKVGKIFGTNNQIAIIYDNKYSEEVDSYLTTLSTDKNITSILSYDLLISKDFTAKELSYLIENFSSNLQIDESLVKFVYYIKFDDKIHYNPTLNELINIVNNNSFIGNYIKKTYKFNYKSLNKADLNKSMDLDELSNYLKVDKKDLKLLYLFYNSTVSYNDSWTMKAEDLISFIKEELVENDYLSKYLPTTKKAELLVAFNKLSTIKSIFVSDKYSRAVLNTNYLLEGKETYDFIKKLKNSSLDKDGIYIAGHSPMAYEMSNSFSHELNRITIITIIFIFIVVAFTFRDLIIPFVLVLLIQSAVYITMSYISLTGGSVYFIALLIVQAILMGATIDYAIVYASYYKEGRKTMNVKDAILYAYNGSIRTILNSASTLIIVTIIVSNFAFLIAAQICRTIAQGTLCSAILVFLVLPGVLATCDKLICRGKKYKR